MSVPNCSFAEIAAVLREKQRFVVMSHMRPDGDALGCSIAFGLCLQALGKEVAVWNQDGVPEKFRYLPGWEMVQPPPAEPQDFEVVVALDTAVQQRVGSCGEAIGRAGLWINMDHHISNNHYGDLAYVDATAPAAGQILYEFFAEQGFPITLPMAENLFAAISTDTGSFQYPSTTARTYEIGARLIEAGVRVGELSQKMYESYPRRRLELLRAALNASQFSVDGRVASFSLTMETAARLAVQPDDSEGLIDHLRAVQGVVVAAFFEELPEGLVRVSLRSKDARADVCAVCQSFGGGGHVLAAGARVRGSLVEVELRVMRRIAEELAGLGG